MFGRSLLNLIKKSCLRLEFDQGNGNRKAKGSAFIVDDGTTLLTAAHNITADITRYRAVNGDNSWNIAPHSDATRLAPNRDIKIFKLVTRGRPYPWFLSIERSEPRQFEGRNVWLGGFLANWQYCNAGGTGFTCKEARIISYNNAIFHLSGLQSENIMGMSGGPIVTEEGKVLALQSSSDENDFSQWFGVWVGDYLEKGGEFLPIVNGIRSAYTEKSNDINSILNDLNSICSTSRLNLANSIANNYIKLLNKNYPPPSIELGKLFSICGLMLIHSNSDAEMILKAQSYLSQALETFEIVPSHTYEVKIAMAYSEWLSAITFKQLGQLDKALMICENMFREDKYKNLPIDNALLYIREIALIRKSNNMFKIIEDKLLPHCSDIVGIFHTYRRWFEINLWLENIGMCQKILPKMQTLYRLIRFRIHPVYIVALKKNMAHYYFLLGNNTQAIKLSCSARLEASTRNFDGQFLAIDKVMKMFLTPSLFMTCNFEEQQKYTQ